MKKLLIPAIFFWLAGCYTPLNNSGVATTKQWLEVSGKKTDFDGKQYDSCYRFDLRFWPQEAAEELNLQEACISACCWRSDKDEVILDFNKNYDKNLAYYGRARKYSPAVITLKVNHANWLNTTKVTVSPKGAISKDGLVKLSYKETENPARLAQLENQARFLQARRNAYLIEQEQLQEMLQETEEKPSSVKATVNKKSTPTSATPEKNSFSQKTQAKNLLQQKAGSHIDNFFYHTDKAYKKQGAIFLLSERILTAFSTDAPDVYQVSCHAQARSGLSSEDLKSTRLSCGLWSVNLTQNTIEALDTKAKRILKKY